jgi:type VI secretion system protein ImpH
MAPTGWRESADLSVRLLREPYRFDFFQAVRLLGRVVRAWSERGPERPDEPVGRNSLPEQEAIRFRTQPSLTFPPSPVLQVRATATADGAPGPAEMLISFLGLVGPCGALPHHYTALLLRRIREKDFSLRDFLDLFHHRLVSLFHRAWEKYRLPFSYEQFKQLAEQQQDDPVTWGLYCLVGFGTEKLRGRLEVPDEAFLYYAGHFAHQPRCVTSLEGLLADFFEMPLTVLSLHGQWLNLDDQDLSRMAGQGSRGGRNNQMGVTLVVGRRIWDVQSKFRLRLGPLNYAQFQRLMPGGDRLKALCQLTRSYVGPELDFDVQPVLRAAEVPRCRLGGRLSQLGWNTWVRSGAMRRDADEAVFKVSDL